MQEEAATEDESIAEVPGQDDIPKGWKYVEVAGSFNELDNEGGGGFVLRDWKDNALMARAFPAPGNSRLSVEAYVVHKAMEEIIAMKEKKVVFCLESEVLYYSIGRDMGVPAGVPSMLIDCIQWWKNKHSFHVFLRKRKEVEAALWLSMFGKQCRQHCQWDSARPWPPGFESLINSRFDF